MNSLKSWHTKKSCIVIVVLFFFTLHINCQDTISKIYKNELQLNLPSVLIGSYNLIYTRHYGPFSLAISPGIKHQIREYDTLQGYSIGIEERISFLSMEDLSNNKANLYIALSAKYIEIERNMSSGSHNTKSYGYGTYLGCRFILKDRFVLSTYGGIVYIVCKSPSYVYPDVERFHYWEPGYSGLRPDVKFCLGFNF